MTISGQNAQFIVHLWKTVIILFFYSLNRFWDAFCISQICNLWFNHVRRWSSPLTALTADDSYQNLELLEPSACNPLLIGKPIYGFPSAVFWVRIYVIS